MPVDSIVRVSFQTVPEANQASNYALVGHNANPTGPRPYTRVGTACYSCSNAEDHAVAECLADLAATISDHAGQVDFVSITIARRT